MERWFRLRAVLLGTLYTLAVPAAQAEACSCIGGTPLCESFWKTPVVFAGEVLDITPTPNVNGTQYMPQRMVRFRVDQVWRGGVAGEVRVHTGAGGGDCGYSFQLGVRYIVYAHHYQGMLTTGICDRTRPLAEAAEDLHYFKTALTPRAVGQVLGRVTYQRSTHEVPIKPIPGYQVTLTSAQKTWKTTTDSDGRYEFNAVPAGKYSVKLSVPETEHAFGRSQVELADPRGCAGGDFYVVSDGRVSARVVDSKGRPGRGLDIELVELDTLQSRERYPGTRSARTDDDGRVEWRQIAPGRYVVGMNITRAASVKQPYGRVFFPGVTELAEAEVIELASGQRIELDEFTLPQELPQQAVSGVVSWPDGSPAARASVLLWPMRDGRIAGTASSATTDAEGRFSLNAPIGQQYSVTAYMNVNTGAGRNQWNAERLVIDLTSDTRPLKLTLAAPRR